MHSSARKLIIARYSGAEIDNTSHKVYKLSPGPVVKPLMATRRINTETNEKKNTQKKYILKKTKNGSNINIFNISKQASASKQKWNAWDKISFVENQWAMPSKEQHLPIKRFTQKPTYGEKVKQLEKVIRGKKQSQRKTQDYQNGLRHRSKNRVVMDCDSHANSKLTNQESSVQKYGWVDEGHPKYQIFYDKLLGSGTFGKVFAGVSLKTGQQVAIKIFENDKSHKCREIELMQMVRSKFVIKIVDKYYTEEKEKNKETQRQIINIVMPKYESSFFQFLKTKNYVLQPAMLKVYLYQIFKGARHLHEKGICHRDLKPQNILISKNKLVICDLGSAKILKKSEPNIAYICSRCYRAPELIFGSTFYSFYIDMWSIGCIILEILNKGPFFIAKDSLHHLIEIMKIMGTPTKKDVLSMNPNYDTSRIEDIPIVSKKCWKEQLNISDEYLLDLIEKVMVYNPAKRLTAEQALQHPYFSDIKNPSFIMSVANEINCHELINSL